MNIGTLRAMGELLNVAREHYGNGRIAIELVTSTGESFAVLSINLPDTPSPPENHFWAKTWSENEPLREPALASGLFEDTGERARTGFVTAELWRIK